MACKSKKSIYNKLKNFNSNYFFICFFFITSFTFAYFFNHFGSKIRCWWLHWLHLKDSSYQRHTFIYKFISKIRYCSEISCFLFLLCSFSFSMNCYVRTVEPLYTQSLKNYYYYFPIKLFLKLPYL